MKISDREIARREELGNGVAGASVIAVYGKKWIAYALYGRNPADNGDIGEAIA